MIYWASDMNESIGYAYKSVRVKGVFNTGQITISFTIAGKCGAKILPIA